VIFSTFIDKVLPVFEVHRSTHAMISISQALMKSCMHSFSRGLVMGPRDQLPSLCVPDTLNEVTDNFIGAEH
jgi:hypothetical protein